MRYGGLRPPPPAGGTSWLTSPRPRGRQPGPPAWAVSPRRSAGQPAAPAGVVVPGVRVGVAAGDEQQGQRRAPVRRDRGRAADDRDDLVGETGVLDRPPERREGVEQPELGIRQRRVVVLPT